jgi:hypothetical protein
MRLQRFAASWRIQLLVALALVHDAGCGSRTDVTCGSDPVLLDGKPTGLETCSDSVVHRAALVACPNPLPRANPACAPTGEAMSQCAVDADCTDFPLGICNVGQNRAYCGCDYGCLTDADCDADQLCLCADPIGRCVAAPGCKSDADCKDGPCTGLVRPDNLFIDFACFSPDNECEVDADCASHLCFNDDTTHLRRCAANSGGGCFGSGRPFLVAGAARTAELARRDDWCGDDAPAGLVDLPADDRAAIAAGWARAGLMEHASIAAFARFTLQLLSLGAPPDLVSDAQSAMADETEHTRLCFSLASAFGGAPVGPGPLSLSGALDGGAAREILATAILEGCVGETVAALEAHEMAQRAGDPAVRRALETIAADEARHAELAWRFVKWAVERDPSLAAVAEGAFAAAVEASARRSVVADEGPDLSAHGLASAAARREVERCALAQVVSPCAAALLASSRRAAQPVDGVAIVHLEHAREELSPVDR